MNKIVIDDVEYLYDVEYKNIKNLYFRIKDDKIIHVSCNKFVSQKEIENILLKNKSFVKRSFDRVNSKIDNSNELYYLGNKLILEVSNDIYIDNDYIYAPSFEKAKEYIYSKALDVFKKRVDTIKQMYVDLPTFSVKCRMMKTRWGVCNIRSMSITLNTELITKDVHLIDYVIVHELCHFKHMDHSPLFWKDVAKYYPYYKEARRELKY